MASVDAFIVVFSVTDEASFLFAGAYVQAIQRRAWKAAGRSASVILVANKNDLVRNRIITDYGNRFFSAPCTLLGGAVVQRVERWTRDR